MTELKGWRKFLHQWGGGTSAFFAYTHFSHDLTTGLITALLPFVRDGLGLNYLESGLLVSAYTITAGIAQVPMGWLGDRMKRNLVAAMGLGGVAISAIGGGLSPSYSVMLAFMIMMGIFGGAYHPSATPLLTGHYESGRRGSAIGIHMLGGSFGFTLGPVLGGLIGESLGWRWGFILLSIPALVSVPLMIRRAIPSEHVISEQAGHAAAGKPAPAITEDRRSFWQVMRPVIGITAIAMLVHTISNSSISFIPLFLVDKHGVAPADAAMLLGVVRGGGMFGSLLGGWLSDKWGRLNAVVAPMVLTGPLVYLVSASPFGAVLMSAFVLFGVAMYTRQSSIQALLMDHSPARFRATIFGIYFGMSQEWVSVAQPAVGYFMDIFGISPVFMGIAWISIAFSAISLLWLRRPKNKPGQQI